MSDLVRAVKTYAYMDRGELVEVDIHEGIKTTLKVLAHKWKHRSIELEKDLDPSIPRLTVHGSELNQVWTNLIDNALKYGQRAQVRVFERDDGSICVQIDDFGPGLPAVELERVFEPFYRVEGLA